MSSKAYTMREMKGIVEYLVEHKAYNEIKGRKMWMNFASSQMTTRTWQSLKETFLKRILPDIYNPYYKLTMEQVRSFKEGRDIEAKKGNKLETQTLTESSNENNGENQKNSEQPSTSKAQTKEAEMTSGEDIKPAKIPSEPRSSADTVVLEVYYNNAEEIKNVLENNIENEKNGEKNIRDCLTFEYTPFNIDAMKVLEDFATESEGSDKEPRMQIDEDPKSPENGEKPENEGNDKTDDGPIEIHDSDKSELEINEEDADEVDLIIEELNKDTEKRNSHTDKHKETAEEQDNVIEKEKTVETKIPADKTENIAIVDDIENLDTIIPPNKTVSPIKSVNMENSDTIIPPNKTASPKKTINMENSDTTIPPNITASPKNSVNMEIPDTIIPSNKSPSPKKSVNMENSETIIPPNKTASPEKSNSIATPIATNSTDASLPNNQEAFDVKKRTTTENNTVKKKTRKRSSSNNSNTSKKVKLNNEKYNKDKIVEETDIIANPSTEEIMDVQPNHMELSTENPNNAEETQNKKVSNETGLKFINDDEINPCLNSVSLYAEQFNTTKYSDNEVETVNENTNKGVEIQEEAPKAIETQEKVKTNIIQSEDKEFYNKPNKAHAIVDNMLNQKQVEQSYKSDEPQENTADAPNKKPLAKLSLKKTDIPTKDDNKSNIKEVVVLKSNSDSVSSEGKARRSKGKGTVEQNKSRERDLANILGFLGGGNRKRNISHRRLGNQKHSITLISESSEWSSESADEEYVSPPRGRKNRHTKKYAKPKSARILSLDEEGGLFVMHGKRMFPVVRDGHLVKNYVAMDTDSNSEEEENYWKQKYVEEKIRADELEKRLKEASSSAQKIDPTLARKSPILQSNTLLRNLSSHKPHNEVVGDLPINQEISKESPKIQSSQEKLKICFSKNNQEVQLEGYWATLHPALQQVVQLLHTDEGDTKAKPARRPSVKKTDKPAKPTEKPATDDNELETVEINSGKTTPIVPTVDPEVHEKINKIEKEIFKEIEELESKAEDKQKPDVEEDSNVTKRPARSGRPKKPAPSTSKAKSIQKEKSPNPPAKEMRSHSKPKKTEEKQNGDQNDTANNVENTHKEQNGEQNGAENDTAKNVEIKARRSSRAPQRFSEDNTTQKRVTRRSASRKTEPPAIDDDEGVRYMLPPNEPKQTSKVAIRSLTEACKQDASTHSIDSTQGYQDSDFSPILIKRKKRERKTSFKTHTSKRLVTRKSLPNLTSILTSDSSNSSYFVPMRRTHSTINSQVYNTDSYKLLVPIPKTAKVLQRINEDQNVNELEHFDSVSNKSESDRSTIIVEIHQGSSSNVSLPMSPELSVVENLTISREMINKTVNLNETCNIGDVHLDYKYVMSDVDVSYPLMEGECELQQRNNNKSPNNVQNKRPATEFPNEKVTTMNKEDKSISDTINKKLHDLLLESAKKISNGKENMEIDESTDVPKIARAKKRCSTPRKRETKKKKAPINPVIEEEHMESCTFGGRRSCPPLINIITPDDDPYSVNETIEPKEKDKAKGKKKKDVIKVKIQKPRSKSKESRTSKDSTKTDSGINETGYLSGMFLKSNDSVDLIHNHSETCLHANECIGDSLEFVENSKSIISLNNSSDSELMRLIDCDKLSGVLECNNAQDGFPKYQPITNENFYSATATEYHSPVNTNTSLITEDLSDELSPHLTKWYLLSEDETNTNGVPRSNRSTQSFGANLNQIFTTCAVPNLSTITERSNDSKKVNIENDGDTNIADSQSLFKF